MSQCILLVRCWWLAIAILLAATSTHAYELRSRWTQTATDSNTGSLGTPITLTWGMVPDGTTVTGSEGSSASDLISFLDTEIGLGAGQWFSLFEDSYTRISQLSGLTFLYESHDSGAALNSYYNPLGSLGQHADLRIGGHSIDGQTGANTLAYNYFPNHGDMVIDTDNTNFFSNGLNNYRALRNVLMHEVGHGLGLDHMTSNNSRFLMEPYISTAFDGPQLDDILALQRNYGDAWEKGAGNDTFNHGTLLGSLAYGGTLSIGAHGDNKVVAPSESDFISIDDVSDLDYFRFTLAEPLAVTLDLTPRGTTYYAGPDAETQTLWDTQALSDLALQLLDSNGSTPLVTTNFNDAGLGESIQYALDSGTYFARVSGSANDVQLYGLSISGSNVADINGDGSVNAMDAGIMFTNWGAEGLTFAEGNIDGDNFINAVDAGILFSNWSGDPGPSVTAIPEPASQVLVLLGLCGVLARSFRQQPPVVW